MDDDIRRTLMTHEPTVTETEIVQNAYGTGMLGPVEFSRAECACGWQWYGPTALVEVTLRRHGDVERATFE